MQISSDNTQNTNGSHCDLFPLHQKLDNLTGVVGTFGGDHAVYHAIVEAKTGKKLHRLKEGHFAPSSEFKIQEIVQHIKKPEVQALWPKITTLDPFGMDSKRPTIASTKACMDIPEIKANLKKDGKIVTSDGLINTIKVAVDPVWNIPALSKKLNIDEKTMRERLVDWTGNEKILDEKNELFLPAIGGTTIYVIGDINAITNGKPVAVRCHDECNGSDVFGTDICSCRPYLVYAIQGCVEAAQEGGVGIICYFRKEGRALGEVTKFRVYNARKYQEGGDRPETYFKQTENIAGVVDARIQELMPDVLHWLGIAKIDRLLSMSSDKYDAITGAGITVVNRVSLPEVWVPKGAYVEISAKISSGYMGFQPTGNNEYSELKNLEMIRQRANQLFAIGTKGPGLPHFKIDLSKIDLVVNRVIATTLKSYPTLKIPDHSRMRHYEMDGINRIKILQSKWNEEGVSPLDQVRRILELIIVSVLLDAGAGNQWSYKEKLTNRKYTRSEGLALATLEMFVNGKFSSDGTKAIVDSEGLKNLSVADLEEYFQVSESNPLISSEGRVNVLRNLGKALEANQQFFGNEKPSRPGYLLDNILQHMKDSQHRTSVRVLWKALQDCFGSALPDPSGLGLGDVYHHSALGKEVNKDTLVPIHKLLQWLCYSLIEPLSSFGIKFVDTWLLTGLAEYRNGGLLVDFGCLVPKDPDAFNKEYNVTDEFIVEWRSLTIAIVDIVAEKVRLRLGLDDQKLPTSKVLEGGTWRAGREVAFELRENGSQPFKVKSLGNVF